MADELEAFTAAEKSVHDVLFAAGWDAEGLRTILALRDQHLPVGKGDAGLASARGEDQGRAPPGTVAHRGTQVVLSEGWGKLYQQQSELLRQTRVDAGALHRVVEHDRRVLVHEKTRVDTLKRERLELAAMREALQEELRLLRSSHSWRLTAPLRASRHAGVDTRRAIHGQMVQGAAGHGSTGRVTDVKEVFCGGSPIAKVIAPRTSGVKQVAGATSLGKCRQWGRQRIASICRSKPGVIVSQSALAL